MDANMGVKVGMSVAKGMSSNVGFSKGYIRVNFLNMRLSGVGGKTTADAGISMSF